MAPPSDPETSTLIPGAESNHQPFFVLHKASTSKPVPKIRRRIDLSPKSSKGSTQELNDKLRLETFKSVWSNTESIIKGVLKNFNGNVFDEINIWVRASFDAIRACRSPDITCASHMFPIVDTASTVTSGASKQIFTGLVFTKNIEFVDDISTFADLGEHLRSHGCYVANLTPFDFSAKNGVGGCLKTLVRQFLFVSVDAPDISVIASWYTEKASSEKPLVVIIDDVERCCGPVLNDFIVMLREWVVKVPIILILGVATTINSLRNILSSNACLYLSVCEFNLGTPAERMDAIIEATLFKSCQTFSIGKHVFTFLRNYFLKHDGTLTLFVKALKIGMVQQVYAEPLSFILKDLVGEEGTKVFDKDSRLQSETATEKAFELPSLQRFSQPCANCIDWARALCELKTLCKFRSTVVMCLYEVGKYRKITLLDICCELLESEPSDHTTNSGVSLQTEGYFVWASQILSGLQAAELCKLLNRWEMLTRGITEIHEKVKELQSLTTVEENRLKCDLRKETKRPTVRNYKNEKSDKNVITEQVTTFLRHMVREYIKPSDNIPFHEIVFFNKVDKLQTALIGDPRRRIQVDLLESNEFLKCKCCSRNVGGGPVPSLPDTSIMYSLAQEHGDLINVHELYRSFREVVSSTPSQVKKRARYSPSPKKRKVSKEPPQMRSDALIQAEFCRAVKELQIIGLLRMPSKRRPNYVQSIAFGV